MMIEMQRGSLLRLNQGAGNTVTAHTGSVWITEEESRRDVILRAGQSFTLHRSGLALVEALSPAVIKLQA